MNEQNNYNKDGIDDGDTNIDKKDKFNDDDNYNDNDYDDNDTKIKKEMTKVKFSILIIGGKGTD